MIRQSSSDTENIAQCFLSSPQSALNRRATPDLWWLITFLVQDGCFLKAHSYSAPSAYIMLLLIPYLTYSCSSSETQLKCYLLQEAFQDCFSFPDKIFSPLSEYLRQKIPIILSFYQLVNLPVAASAWLSRIKIVSPFACS